MSFTGLGNVIGNISGVASKQNDAVNENKEDENTMAFENEKENDVIDEEAVEEKELDEAENVEDEAEDEDFDGIEDLKPDAENVQDNAGIYKLLEDEINGMDISAEQKTEKIQKLGEKGQEDLWLTDEFGETEAGKWLMENAHKYGFILRFPEGKENITGYMYESWHYRYVGEKHAEAVYKQNVTLEEYLDIVQY